MDVSKDTLRTVAGWSLANQRGGEADLGLKKLRDGCEAVLECFPAPVVTPTPDMAVHATVALTLKGGNTNGGVQSDEQGCQHRFHIATQTCIYCGLTYLQAMGRLAEIMGK